MPCPPSVLACQLDRIADQLSSWNWDSFTSTLIATLVGAGVALFGAWWLAKRDGDERYQLRLTEAIVRAINAAATANRALGLFAGAASVAEIHTRASEMSAAPLELAAAQLLARPASQEEQTLKKLATLTPHFIGSENRAQHPDRFLVVVNILGRWPKTGKRSEHEELRRLIEEEIEKVNPITRG